MNRCIIYVVIVIGSLIMGGCEKKSDVVEQPVVEQPVVEQSVSETTAVGTFVTLPSGVSYKDIVIGNGNEVQVGSRVEVDYQGKLQDGTTFDSSYDRGKTYEFTVGLKEVILGWEEGIIGMRQGGKRQLVIPPQMAYGEVGIEGIIPSNATLFFEVELIAVD